MPAIARFRCDDDRCEFAGPQGWGYYMYAVDDDGRRVECSHPGEHARAREMTSSAP